MIEGRGFAPGLAGLAVTLFFGSIMVGRVLIGFISNRLGNRRLIRAGLIVAVTGSALLLIPDVPALALLGLTLFGLGCAPVYPGLMHETPRRFDAVTARKVIGWQVAAAGTGAAIMPAVFGVIAAHLGMEAVFPVVFVLAAVLLALSIRLDRMTPVADSTGR
jgi:MFS family permease